MLVFKPCVILRFRESVLEFSIISYLPVESQGNESRRHQGSTKNSSRKATRAYSAETRQISTELQYRCFAGSGVQVCAFVVKGRLEIPILRTNFPVNPKPVDCTWFKNKCVEAKQFRSLR